MLQHLGQLKAALVERYERYARSPGASAEAIPAIKVAMQNPAAQAHSPVRRASQAQHAQAQRVVADEAARWRAQREEAAQRDAAFAHSQRSQNPYSGPSPISTAGGYTSSASSSAAAQNASYPSPTAYLSSASASAAAATAASARGPAPAPIPVSLAGGGASSGANQRLEAVPPSFGRAPRACRSQRRLLCTPPLQIQIQTTARRVRPAQATPLTQQPILRPRPAVATRRVMLGVLVTRRATLGQPQARHTVHPRRGRCLYARSARVVTPTSGTGRVPMMNARPHLSTPACLSHRQGRNAASATSHRAWRGSRRPMPTAASRASRRQATPPSPTPLSRATCRRTSVHRATSPARGARPSRLPRQRLLP
ncbi:hypothetical protein C8F04DRAFT_242122 [Mycena alexandri]|uniref:Uncharacterized protein n=1 Tax=Mycena alexandri TaxID=1745969 RepID=A0AAD6WPK4_9AGAR|nr:hypothetical protein C8F04DRAFT_242122 [Mycena alexandri]